MQRRAAQAVLWRIRRFFYLKLVFGWSVLEGAVRKAGVVFGLLLATMDVRDSRLWSKKQNGISDETRGCVTGASVRSSAPGESVV